jgi:hypothetical protein
MAVSFLVEFRLQGYARIRDMIQYLELELYPVQASPQLLLPWKEKLPSYLWTEVSERRKKKSLRSLAREYGVSHETVRRTLAAQRGKLPLYQ